MLFHYASAPDINVKSSLKGQECSIQGLARRNLDINPGIQSCARRRRSPSTAARHRSYNLEHKRGLALQPAHRLSSLVQDMHNAAAGQTGLTGHLEAVPPSSGHGVLSDPYSDAICRCCSRPLEAQGKAPLARPAAARSRPARLPNRRRPNTQS